MQFDQNAVYDVKIKKEVNSDTDENTNSIFGARENDTPVSTESCQTIIKKEFIQDKEIKEENLKDDDLFEGTRQPKILSCEYVTDCKKENECIETVDHSYNNTSLETLKIEYSPPHNSLSENITDSNKEVLHSKTFQRRRQNFQNHSKGINIKTSNSRRQKETCRDQSKLQGNLNDIKEDVFNCTECGKSFKQMKSLSNHLTVHKRFRCTHCNKGFVRWNSFKKHLTKYIDTNISQCIQCEETFSDSSSFEKHLLMYVRDEKSFKCLKCKQTCDSPLDLDRHMELSHNIKKIGIFMCDCCSKTFSRRYFLVGHLKRRKNNVWHKCTMCIKTFVSKAKLKKHIDKHNTGKLQPAPKPKYVKREYGSAECLKCGKVFQNKYILKKHTAVHGEKTFKCTECGKKFAYKYNLAYHMRIHFEKAFACKECGKTFHQKSNLSMHLHRHKRDRITKCNICAASIYKYSLSRHMRIHTSALKFECSECGKKFVQKSGLVRHIKNHY